MTASADKVQHLL